MRAAPDLRPQYPILLALKASLYTALECQQKIAQLRGLLLYWLKCSRQT